jgi:hypothetical protein
MFDGSLSGENRSQYVDVEDSMEVFLGNRLDWHEFVDSEVVNQNIEASIVSNAGTIVRMLRTIEQTVNSFYIAPA